ncbi:MAG: ATP-binding cassette domain-containing protein [Gammaproteobacteria bacterium]|nr:ATP-binding cassette domain-containing protein [Gammaproteobacteria bacterium]MDE0252661.1 ATP-binding cassette domain-containing protein [Gammaproteobacteria bacterium]MDE0403581.1 ATP-binding cassette domain-containing protein [Gammaproteobacteria bacterium]
MLSANHLTRTYGDVIAVNDVSFEISSGEIVGLLGHNGAGKTTVMKLLTGYIEPSAGSASVDGIDVQENPVAARSNLGYLPESRPLYNEFTVADYLWFTATVRGVLREQRQDLIARALQRTGLVGRALETIGTLSRGYQQRVGVAQAILHNPGTLILDEPTNGLDPSQTQHMRELVQRLAKDATVVLSTHIMQEVEAICSRVLIMRDGVIAVDESMENLKEGNRCWLSSNASLEEVKTALNGSMQVRQFDGRYLIAHEDSSIKCDIPAIVRTLVANDIAVNRIEPEKRDLEALFRMDHTGGMQ